jgi:fused signal recognition particle receptor
MTWLDKLKSGLKKSSQLIESGIRRAFSEKTKEIQINDVFDCLILSDIGIETANTICDDLKKCKFGCADDALRKVAELIVLRLSSAAQPFCVTTTNSTHVVLVSGVNGSGKTTSIAKLTKQCLDLGLTVEWAACDTFRAGAVDQLCVWGTRLGVHVYTTYPGQGAKPSPSALAYSALEQAKRNGVNVLFVDTAGRLQNNEPLMKELAHIATVLKKVDPAAPHQSLLVIDGTSGQNAFSQVELFKKFVPLSGIVVTKLDGTSKAGFLVGMFQKTQIPVVAIGVGERIDDMNTFDAQAFAHAIVGL